MSATNTSFQQADGSLTTHTRNGRNTQYVFVFIQSMQFTDYIYVYLACVCADIRQQEVIVILSSFSCVMHPPFKFKKTHFYKFFFIDILSHTMYMYSCIMIIHVTKSHRSRECGLVSVP